MNSLVYKTAIVLLPLLFLLGSCSDDAYVEGEEQSITQQVLIMPTSTPIDKYFLYTIEDSVFLESNKAYKFSVEYLINGKIYNEADEYYSGLLWNIDGEMFNIPSFQHSFETPGQKSGYLETIDLFGDTARTSFTIFVNTPNAIALEYPYDGFNQLERDSTKGIPLKWKTTGIDPWEKATCTIFAADDIDSIWNQSLGTVDCNSDISLQGVFNPKKNLHTVYWAVVMNVSSAGEKTSTETSKIFHFTSKIRQNSALNIPIKYASISKSTLISTEVVLLSIYDDTLGVYHNESTKGSITAHVPPQSGVKVHVRETLQKEFVAKDFIIDIPESTYVIADTVYFVDRTPPQVGPFKTSFAKQDSIQFLVYDDGAGVNPQKLKLLVNDDTLEFSYRQPTLLFEKNCKSTCRVNIFGEDYARNPIPKINWFIQSDADSLHISGPFTDENI